MAFTVTYSKTAKDTNAALTSNTQIVRLIVNHPLGAVSEKNGSELNFLATDPIEIGGSISLKNGPAAAVAGKLNELLSSKLIKALAGGALEGSVIPSDSWTQQVVEKSEPISIKLKFRVYSDLINQASCNSNYNTIVRAFAEACSPPGKKYSLGNNPLDPIIAVGRNLSSLVEAAKQAQPEDADDGAKDVSVVKTIVKIANNIVDSAAKPLGWTWYIITNDFGNKTLPWALISWSVTPSAEFVWNEELKVPDPIYADFEAEFKTTQSPSNKTFLNWLSHTDSTT